MVITNTMEQVAKIPDRKEFKNKSFFAVNSDLAIIAAGDSAKEAGENAKINGERPYLLLRIDAGAGIKTYMSAD